MDKTYKLLFRVIALIVFSITAAAPLDAIAVSPLLLNREAYIYSYGYSSTPVVGDVNGDGFPEIVFGSRYTNSSGGTGYLQVVQKKADNSVVRLLTKDMGGIPRAPALGDVNNDGIPEIVVFVSRYYGSTGMRVEALHADGTVVWSVPINDYGAYYDYYGDYAISLGDVNGDGYPDVVALSFTKLHVLSGLDGRLLWQKTYSSNTYGATAVLNLDDQGGNEVIHVQSDANAIYIYRSDGSLWWTGQGGDFAVSDLELDGKPEIITKTPDQLRVYSHDGTLKWFMSYPFGVSYLSGPAVADLDQDGFPEIAVAVSEYVYPGSYLPRKNYIVAIGGKDGVGVEKWRSPVLAVGEFDNPSLTCTDLDGNGTPEVTVISDDIAAMVLDGLTGAVLWSSNFNIDENEHSPVIADVDNDGHAEIVTPGGTGVPYVSVLGDDLHFVQTRGTWNQMSYTFTNVNNDLSITDNYTPWKTHNTWRTQLPRFVDIKPDIAVHPASLDFGSVPLGNTSTLTVAVSNSGTGNLVVSAATITDQHASEFTQTNDCSTVTPGAACAIEITFKPVSIGSRNAALNIISNDPDTPTVMVPLMGTAVDTTPPATAITLSGVPCHGDWHRSDVQIVLTATDNAGGSGVREIRYLVDGAETVVAGDTASFIITMDGMHIVSYYALDNAGNAEQKHEIVIKIDKTKPAITSSQAPAPNAYGWNNTDITVTFTCSDATSEIASCSSPITVSSEGQNQTVNGVAEDHACNLSTIVVTANIDKTAPLIYAMVSPEPNANGWHNTDTTVRFVCSDALSGIASCPAPITVTTEGAGQVISGTAVDMAGNTATTSVTLNIDKTAPILNISVKPGMLWPPNHKMVTVTPIVSVQDNIDAAVQVKLLSVTSNEPDNGLGDGDTADDIEINSDGTLSLRAERSGKGSGRVYTIIYQATDAAGNSASAAGTVSVPHNK